MKSNVPWSVKGIDPEARVVAKAAAREAGMTLGEWMNQAIREVGERGDDEPQADAPRSEAIAATGVTTEQLRAVVDSLNRLNERLTTTEQGLKTQEAQSRQTAMGLGQGLETVYERMKRLERERRESTSEAITERVEKLERGEGDKGRIEGLKRLESALTSMVEALEVTRREAITKIGENEQAVAKLSTRVDGLDERLTAGFSEVHRAIDAVGHHLERTERAAADVMSDAKAAAGSDDAAFVEQTSKRLQALGNEIKRSGDQIRTVEEMVGKLSAKIEAAEHRSAEGIGEVASSLAEFQAEIQGREVAAPTLPESHDAADDLAEAAAEADRKVARLQRSYDAMMARLEGRAVEEEPDAPAEDEALAAELARDGASDDDFDAVFADLAPSREGEGADDAAPPAAQPLASDEGADTLTAPLDAAEEDDAAPTALNKLTARQKVLLAAKARKKRLEAERAAEADASAAPAADAPEAATDRPEDDPFLTVQTEERPSEAEGKDGRRGLYLLALVGVLACAVAFASYRLFGGSNEVAAIEEPTAAVAAAPGEEAATAPRAAPPADLPPPSASAPTLYEEGMDMLGTGRESEALRLFREAADLGHVPAQFRVGHAYYDGIGTERDVERAREYLLDAALSNNVLAMHYLGNIEANAPESERNIDAAIEWFRQAADYGVVSSAYNLGYLYDPTVEEALMPQDRRDAARAYYWYGIAAKQGDEPARIDAELVAASLTPEAVAEIDERVADWTPLRASPTVNDGLSLPS